MAVTSIWRVHGSVGKVLDYVENKEKTTAVSGNDIDLSDVIDYAIRQHKTSQTQVRDGEMVVQRFVSGINCHPSTAKMEMQKIKKVYGKEDGVIAYHGYQSFAPGEATPELAHEIGIKLAQRLWGDRYQVVVATHLDRANHLHSHFVINTVSFVDGIKYHRTKQDYRQMQLVSDELCREYGLSVIQVPKGRGKTYNEWAAEKYGKPTLRGVIRSDIDRAVLSSTTQRHFLDAMQQMGYTIKTKAADGQPLKYPALKPPGAKNFFRFHRLGPGYSLEEILDRVYDNIRRSTPFPEADREAARKSVFVPYPKAKGIYALYLRYCYELHIIQKHPASVKRVPFSMRRDLTKLDKLDAETRFLAKFSYATAQELTDHKESASTQMQALVGQRTQLRNQLKVAVRAEDAQQIESLKFQIQEVSSEIKNLRKEVSLCDAILLRSEQMTENLSLLEQEKEIERKEEEVHKLHKRGSRSGGQAVVERR